MAGIGNTVVEAAILAVDQWRRQRCPYQSLGPKHYAKRLYHVGRKQALGMNAKSLTFISQRMKHTRSCNKSIVVLTPQEAVGPMATRNGRVVAYSNGAEGCQL